MSEAKYSKAIKKLDEIIQKIEQEEIDVDDLSQKVKEAAELLTLCKDKIEKSQMEVKQITEQFSTEETKNGR